MTGDEVAQSPKPVLSPRLIPSAPAWLHEEDLHHIGRDAWGRRWVLKDGQWTPEW